jgi:hypothetical protein
MALAKRGLRARKFFFDRSGVPVESRALPIGGQFALAFLQLTHPSAAVERTFTIIAHHYCGAKKMLAAGATQGELGLKSGLQGRTFECVEIAKLHQQIRGVDQS